MAGQGSTISRIASLLRVGQWEVVFVCIPNTPHIGVVPIPTNGAATAQRYPDILAVKGDCLKLIEVEMVFSADVGKKAVERFSEQRDALASQALYHEWKARVLELTGVSLPSNPRIICELVLLAAVPSRLTHLLADVTGRGIAVITANDYGED